MQQSETPLITIISGATVRVKGKTNIPITVGGITLDTELYIIKRIKNPLILGLQFLQDANAKITFYNSQLLLQHRLSMVQLNHVSVPNTRYLKTAQITSLPPYSETDIKVTLPTDRGSQRNAIAKPSTIYLGHKQLIGCHCLIANIPKTTIYRVCNPTDTTISIPIYSKIAEYEPISDNTRIERWTDWGNKT
jgi:hypothetical protein